MLADLAQQKSNKSHVWGKPIKGSCWSCEGWCTFKTLHLTLTDMNAHMQFFNTHTHCVHVQYAQRDFRFAFANSFATQIPPYLVLILVAKTKPWPQDSQNCSLLLLALWSSPAGDTERLGQYYTINMQMIGDSGLEKNLIEDLHYLHRATIPSMGEKDLTLRPIPIVA